MKKTKDGSFGIFYRFSKNRAAMIGLVILFIFFCTAIFADFISPYERGIKQNGAIKLRGPSRDHIFGTDDYGRDVFTRVVHGARSSLTLGIVSTAASVFFALIFGSICGYFGGKADEIIMRIMDTIMCIPGILLSLAIVAALGPGLGNLMVAISVSYIPTFTRLIRSVVLTIVKNDYIEAARACGSGDFSIIYNHVIRNAMGPIIVQATMSVAGMILLAAGLSFIGLGVRPPAPEWGAMLSEAREFLRRAPYLMVFPGGSILLCALSFNLLGDGLRDALDPRLIH